MVEKVSILTCPECGAKHEEIMPKDDCEVILRPQPGDCCVYCSYGSEKCPSKQEEELS
jgi:hypothetical protein